MAAPAVAEAEADLATDGAVEPLGAVPVEAPVEVAAVAAVLEAEVELEAEAAAVVAEEAEAAPVAGPRGSTDGHTSPG